MKRDTTQFLSYLARQREALYQREREQHLAQPDPENEAAANEYLATLTHKVPAPALFVTETITDTAPAKTPSLPLGEGGRGGEVIFHATGTYPLAQLVSTSTLMGGNHPDTVKPQEAVLFVEAEQAGLYATLTLSNNPATFGRDFLFRATPKATEAIGKLLRATVTAGEKTLWSAEHHFDDYTLWEVLLPTKGIQKDAELTLTIAFVENL